MRIVMILVALLLLCGACKTEEDLKAEEAVNARIVKILRSVRKQSIDVGCRTGCYQMLKELKLPIDRARWNANKRCILICNREMSQP